MHESIDQRSIKSRRPLWLRIILKVLRVTSYVLLACLTFLLVRAFDSRSKPPLKLWHTYIVRSEFEASDRKEINTLADYLDLEDEVFTELEQNVLDVLPQEDRVEVNRYHNRSKHPPVFTEYDWNRTVELPVEDPKGGVLLLHGLTDAPYSLRHIAELYQGQGYYVLAIRLPGHGTIPSALNYCHWRDWAAATEIGAETVKVRIGEDMPFHIVGYSNGSALAVNYALDALDHTNLPSPDQLILISPMIGIDSDARLTKWISLVGAIPFFRQSRWLDITPEYMPYKYCSFPANAAYQSYLITRKLEKKLKRVAEAGDNDQLPPIMAFQSVADATVTSLAVADVLYENLSNPGDELILFGVNSNAPETAFFKPGFCMDTQQLLEDPARSYHFKVLSNREPASSEVVEFSAEPGQTKVSVKETGLAWSDNFYSLSHVALPFPCDDKVYGLDSWIGGAVPRGEKDTLTVPIDLIMRLKCNPFHEYMMNKIQESVLMSHDDNLI